MFQIPGFRIPQPNCFTIPVAELPYMGGNDSHKQTDKIENNSI